MFSENFQRSPKPFQRFMSISLSFSKTPLKITLTLLKISVFGGLMYCFDLLNLQVLALSVVFFTLFAGNMTTLLYVLKQKVSKTIGVPEMPCG